ncbi:GFA family protein [Thalassobaculum litoreum]|uniref:Uncharacterized conserved protein n=1 Tax=Thalassobaculum litoreum DSM 18839 TaxID=1123362 RepID=A0A8G2EY79_9PROT|nr:GFA family protein [Thalassobaculum litoreum]SDG47069.1 Uncharacterized conserved protein [Thalassobaculum litoreum DSM 18839]
MVDHPARTGGCMCGGVRYKITGPIKQIVACHCRECRRMTGHFLPSFDVWNEHFEMVESRDLGWYRSAPKSRRGFCKTCGCSIFFRMDGGEKMSIAAGSLDDGCDGDLQIAAHIFTAEKGDYYDLDDAPAYTDGGDSVPMPPRG